MTRWTFTPRQVDLSWESPEPGWKDHLAPWAFSVRPDLWGPGWEAHDPESEGWLVDWGYRGSPSQPDLGSGAPGVAEALVLAGRVFLERHEESGLPWVAVEAP